MLITPNSTIREIQKDFQAAFPGLNIAFYTKESMAYDASSKKNEYPLDTVISSIASLQENVNIVLNAQQTVKDFENSLEAKMGLHVQVFRKSNDLWIQTTKTDHWTLEVQNGKGIRSQQN